MQQRTYNFSVTVTVDDEDSDILSRLDKLYERGSLNKRVEYAMNTSTTIDGYMGIHRAILARMGKTYGKGYNGDHENGKATDNRRANLRVVTTYQNQRNKSNSSADHPTTYKGVSWHKGRGRWMSVYSTGLKGKRDFAYLGYYDTDVEAALAYDKHVIDNDLKIDLNFPIN